MNVYSTFCAVPELHEFIPVELDLNIELFRVPTKSGLQCPTTPKPVFTTPTWAHTSSIGPQATIVDGWKRAQTPVEARRCTSRQKLEHFAKRDQIEANWHLRTRFRAMVWVPPI